MKKIILTIPILLTLNQALGESIKFSYLDNTNKSNFLYAYVDKSDEWVEIKTNSPINIKADDLKGYIYWKNKNSNTIYKTNSTYTAPISIEVGANLALYTIHQKGIFKKYENQKANKITEKEFYSTRKLSQETIRKLENDTKTAIKKLIDDKKITSKELDEIIKLQEKTIKDSFEKTGAAKEELSFEKSLLDAYKKKLEAVKKNEQNKSETKKPGVKKEEVKKQEPKKEEKKPETKKLEEQKKADELKKIEQEKKIDNTSTLDKIKQAAKEREEALKKAKKEEIKKEVSKKEEPKKLSLKEEMEKRRREMEGEDVGEESTKKIAAPTIKEKNNKTIETIATKKISPESTEELVAPNFSDEEYAAKEKFEKEIKQVEKEKQPAKQEKQTNIMDMLKKQMKINN